MKINRLCFVVPCALATAAYAGPDWVEMGDAGSSLATAQPIVGIGQPQRIEGNLSTGLFANGDYEDMYLLRIETPTSFSFDAGLSDFNTMLWLFNVTQAQEAFGLLANDDASPNSTRSLIVGPGATDGSGALVVNPGVYALAITGFGRVPVSRTGNIFFLASNTEISGPDGPGGINPLQGWTGVGETGHYVIDLTGIGYVNVPAPGAGLVLAGAMACAARRRRR